MNEIDCNASAVKVAVLIRPLLPLETRKGCANVLEITGPGTVRLIDKMDLLTPGACVRLLSCQPCLIECIRDESIVCHVDTFMQ